MAEFSFYITRGEIPLILGDLFSGTKLRFVADQNFWSPEAPLTDRFDDAFMETIVNGLFFAVGPFTVEPVVLRKISAGRFAGSYTINVQKSGPLLEVACPTERLTGDKVLFGGGLLSYHADYLSQTAGGLVPVPAELKECYATLVKKLKKHLQKVRSKSRDVAYLSIGIMRELKSGRGEVEIGGERVSMEGLDVGE